MRRLFKLLRWIVYGQLGFIGFRRVFIVLKGIPRYLGDLYKFKSAFPDSLEIMPCLADWNEESGTSRGEYFWQDLYAAQKIFTANPEYHVDIGSRVDGFVAHIASFRKVEVFDVRPNASIIPNIAFKTADIMDIGSIEENYCDSISCLHALEHFGLGRYGDPINLDGWKIGLKTIAKMLRKEGLLYLTVPSGKPRVYFNAHRVLSPVEILEEAQLNSLKLIEFSICDDIRGFKSENIFSWESHEFVNSAYRLCFYIFKKQTIS